jgi:hypothetical protein
MPLRGANRPSRTCVHNPAAIGCSSYIGMELEDMRRPGMTATQSVRKRELQIAAASNEEGHLFRIRANRSEGLRARRRALEDRRCVWPNGEAEFRRAIPTNPSPHTQT